MSHLEKDDVIYCLLEFVFNKIISVHSTDSNKRIFRIVHRFRAEVKMVSGPKSASLSPHYTRARSLYLALPPLVWISWDAGRGKKSDENVAILQQALKEAANG